jgi:hypothetical protein
LQRLLTCSFSGKALAVKRVTENKGKRTSGVDMCSGLRRNCTAASGSADMVVLSIFLLSFSEPVHGTFHISIRSAHICEVVSCSRLFRD